MAASVAFPPQLSHPVDAGLECVALDIVNAMASKVSARSNTGSDVFRQRSRASVNVMKMPALGQHETLTAGEPCTHHFRRTT